MLGGEAVGLQPVVAVHAQVQSRRFVTPPACSPDNLPPALPAPADMVRRTLKLNDQIKQLAADLKDEQSCLMFGRGRNYATAMEAALKVGGLAGTGLALGAIGARSAAVAAAAAFLNPQHSPAALHSPSHITARPVPHTTFIPRR